ncbi:PAS domain S-box protein [Crocinitomix catalasitica]|uniref:PAS domain S-box protein n=1 Tax=Crocinitomix catalasitica TaxID=184607 RepID=UPI00048A4222|nr:PAS domain S-box protein [Crocinitomix catalasitica]
MLVKQLGFLTLLISPLLVFAEKNDAIIDSLVLELSSIQNSEKKSDVLYELAQTYLNTNCKRAEEYGKLALEVAEEAKYYVGIMHGYEILGDIAVIYDVNFLKARTYYIKANSIATYLKDDFKSVKLRLKNILVNYNLGERKGIEKELDKTLNALLNNAEIQDLSEIYAFMANVYFEVDLLAKGEDYIIHILKNVRDKGRDELPIIELISAARYYLFTEKYTRAKIYLQSAIEKAKFQENKIFLVAAYYHMTRLSMASEDYEVAVDYCLKGIEISKSGGFNLAQLENYKVLIKAYDALNNFSEELDQTKIYFALRDSLSQAQYSAQTLAFENEYKNILSEKEIEQTKIELRTKELEIANDALLIRLAIVALCATVLILILLYARLRYKNTINRELEDQKIELEKLSIVAANIEQMVLIADSSNRITWVNAAFERKYGYIKFELIGKSVNDIIYGTLSDENTRKEIENTVFDAKFSYDGVIEHYKKDGNSFVARVHYTPIKNDKEEITRYVLISQDITEKKKIEEEIEELSLVANNTTNSIVIFDKDHSIIWINEGFETVLGVGLSKAKGKNIVTFFENGLVGDEDKIKLRNLFLKNEAFIIEIEHINRLNNEHFWLSLNVNPVVDAKGQIEKTIAVATDITEIKKLENLYTSLVEGSSDLIYETNETGYFVFANDVLTAKTGYEKVALSQMNYQDVVRRDYKKTVKHFYENQLKDLVESTYFEFPIVSKDGEDFWVGQAAHLKIDATGKAVGFRVIARDISAKRDAEEALKRTYRNAKLLGEIGMQITATRSLVEIINKLYDNINQLMDANVFGIGVPINNNTELFFPNAIESGQKIDDFSFDLKKAKDRLAIVSFIDQKEIIIGDFYQEYKAYVPSIKSDYPIPNSTSTSIIYLPLLLKDKIIGVITVQSFKPHAYDEYQVSLVRSLASFVAIALENVSLYETMEDKIQTRTKEVRLQKEELEINYYNTRLLSEIGQLIASTLSIDEIFVQVFEKISKLMPADLFGIGQLQSEDGQIDVQEIINGQIQELDAVEFNENLNLESWCIENKKEIRISNFESERSDYLNADVQLKRKSFVSQLYYPLIVEQSVMGYITIQSSISNAYQPYHSDIIKTLASYIGTVLSNANLYRTLELKVAQRTVELAQKNKDIMASIAYAKRLQKGILPSKNFVSQLLPESFVFFEPKDIVSGDFYWIERIGNKVLMAVVDCTGHGVPGAMMSIIGKNLLDQAVHEKGYTEPAEIMNFLQAGLSLSFGQTSEDKSELYDGMDLALCNIDFDKNRVEFAGANNSLYLVRDNELHITKGNSVGITVEVEEFTGYTNSVIEIQKGDMIYMTSDGYPDQFGGPKYKKFTSKLMRELMVEIANKPIDEQAIIIKQQHQKWKGDKDQTDDVCFLGLRI